MNNTESKICLTCNRSKPLTEFPLHRQRPDGRSAECIKCRDGRRMRHEAADRIYNRQLRTGPVPYVLERQEILPSAPKTNFTYTNARLIPQQVVLPLMYVFDQIDEMHLGRGGSK